MFKIIVFTHGELSESLKKTAELISGPNDNIEYYGIPLGCDTRTVLTKVSASINASEKVGMEVLLLTDLFFGTPFNLLMSLVRDHKFGHITGVNLPMLLEATAMQNQNELSLKEVVSELVRKSRDAIDDCDEFVQNILRKMGG
ncbi:MAG: hypothetical protein VB108_03265 [Anaerolineaceae bacterium]|nr:hypothetical protein [Anaerolineaceae bacterium]